MLEFSCAVLVEVLKFLLAKTRIRKRTVYKRVHLVPIAVINIRNTLLLPLSAHSKHKSFEKNPLKKGKPHKLNFAAIVKANVKGFSIKFKLAIRKS